jgi:hypothetical protein
MCKVEKDPLLAVVRNSAITSVSIVGMAKNVGKTVTMNALVAQAAKQGLCLGLTSVGRDGEKHDEVFHTPKPRIFAPAGCLLATARGTLKNSEIAIEMIKDTGFSTAMGEVIIGRALKSGYVELAGPTLIKHHRILLELLQLLGADLVIVDGALDRVSSATPALAKAVILATGAVLGTSAPTVIEKTRDRIERLTLPQVDECDIERYHSIMEQHKVGSIDVTGQVSVLPVEGSLIAGKIISQKITRLTKTVVMAGAVGNGVLEGLLANKALVKNLCLVIRNGTCLFCDRVIWRRFIENGGCIKVVEPIHLLAVTLNPTSIKTMQFQPREFFELAAKMLAPYPVMDVVMGYSSIECSSKS